MSALARPTTRGEVRRAAELRKAASPTGRRVKRAGGVLRLARVGQTVELRSSDPVTLDSGVVVPAGMTIHGEVIHTKNGERHADAPELTLRFTHLEIGDEQYAIVAEPFRLLGKDDALTIVAEIGGEALVGEVVGAVTKKAPKGTVVGGVLGTGAAVVSNGNQIVLPAGQKLGVRLSEPVTLNYEAKGKKK